MPVGRPRGCFGRRPHRRPTEMPHSPKAPRTACPPRRRSGRCIRIGNLPSPRREPTVRSAPRIGNLPSRRPAGGVRTGNLPPRPTDGGGRRDGPEWIPAPQTYRPGGSRTANLPSPHRQTTVPAPANYRRVRPEEASAPGTYRPAACRTGKLPSRRPEEGVRTADLPSPRLAAPETYRCGGLGEGVRAADLPSPRPAAPETYRCGGLGEGVRAADLPSPRPAAPENYRHARTEGGVRTADLPPRPTGGDTRIAHLPYGPRRPACPAPGTYRRVRPEEASAPGTYRPAACRTGKPPSRRPGGRRPHRGPTGPAACRTADLPPCPTGGDTRIAHLPYGPRRPACPAPGTYRPTVPRDAPAPRTRHPRPAHRRPAAPGARDAHRRPPVPHREPSGVRFARRPAPGAYRAARASARPAPGTYRAARASARPAPGTYLGDRAPF